MARYPGATWRPLSAGFLPGKRLIAHNRVNIHAQAGRGSLFGYYNRSGRVSSHFWISQAGAVEQYVDTDYQAEADRDGNDATISIEHEGSGAEPMTGPQLAASIALIAWLCDTHGIPRQLARDSKIGPSSRGISWHRLGVDGNFPAAPSRYAGRRQLGGGMRYSTATGKVCPGNQIIDQIHDVILPALTGGGTVPVSNPVSNPAPAPAPTPPPALNADGSLRLAVDGDRGRATIGRWQEVMGTPIDWTITPYPPGSSLIRADQRFLNAVVGAEHIRNLTGRPQLAVDGDEGPRTVKVRQFWLYNRLAPRILGRPARGRDFDGSPGPETTRLHQIALNEATRGSGRY